MSGFIFIECDLCKTTATVRRTALSRQAGGPEWFFLTSADRQIVACSEQCRIDATAMLSWKEGVPRFCGVTHFRPLRGRSCLPKPLQKGWPAPPKVAYIESPIVFVSGPLRGGDGDQAKNALDAMRVGHTIRDLGFVPFVPHLYHFVDVEDLARPEDYWLGLCRDWVSLCGALVRLPGKSEGADMEVGWAKEFQKPIWFGLDAFRKDPPVVVSKTQDDDE